MKKQGSFSEWPQQGGFEKVTCFVMNGKCLGPLVIAINKVKKWTKINIITLAWSLTKRNNSPQPKGEMEVGSSIFLVEGHTSLLNLMN